jgi:hypothetical protein
MIQGIGTMKKILGKIKARLFNSNKERHYLMDKENLGNVIATQLIECISNSKYGYMSSNSKYSELNDEGVKVMMSLIKSLTGQAHDIYELNKKNIAEQYMIDSLKK